jgi:hypothetical protein
MTSRRRFLHSSAAVAAAGTLADLGSMLASPSAVRAANPSGILTVDAVVVDQRFEQSVEFGRALAQTGAQIYTMRGDVTDVWYSRLHPQWKVRGGVVAGLTGGGVLFCLERLGWDHGLRVVQRGLHQPFGADGIQHALLGKADWSALERDSANSVTPWPAALAAAIAGMHSPCPAVPSSRELRATCTTAPGRPGRAIDTLLFSWVIATPARV